MELILSGGGEFKLQNDEISCSTPFKIIRQTASVLELKGESAGSGAVVLNGGSGFINHIGSVGTIQQGDFDTVNMFSSGTVMTVSGGSTMHITPRGTFVNGMKMTSHTYRGVTFQIPEGTKIVSTTGEKEDEKESVAVQDKKRPAPVKVTMDKISSIEMSGVCTLRIHGFLAKTLELELEGTSKVIFTDAFAYTELTARASGASRIEFGNTTVDECSITASGASTISGFWVSSSCRLTAEGVSKIYGNQDASCKQRVRESGMGSVGISVAKKPVTKERTSNALGAK